MEEYKIGEYIIYVNGDKYELGRIKKLTEDGAFICYHEGKTAAKTPYDLIHKLVNGFTIKKTTIGGKVFKESEGKEPKTGRWIEEVNDYGEITHWHCSKCYGDSGFITTCKWGYCPNCGAKMVEPQESEGE